MQWVFVLLVAPLILLALIEAGLRAGGYGCSVHPFTRHSENGRTVFVLDRHFYEQFFAWKIPPEQWMRHEQAVPETKPANTCRVFVFGSSAAAGWPDPRESFSRILSVLLKTRYPSVNFEMHNLSYPGLNSHVMRAIAHECARLQPDVFLVYMGNNEVSGPFGLVTGTSTRSRAWWTWLIQTRIKASNFRLIQLMSRSGIENAVTAAATSKSITGDQSRGLRVDDPVLSRVYSAFRANLEDLCNEGARAGATTVLSTVGGNLRDWPPMFSGHCRDLEQSVLRQWTVAFERGKSAQEKAEYSDATAAYKEALALDDSHAELQFRLATCLAAIGADEEAKPHYLRALETDSFYWVRAKPAVNRAIRETAKDFAARRVCLADSAEQLERGSPHGVPGVEYFGDNCHLILDGAYVVACTFLAQLEQTLPDWVRSQAGSTPLPTPEACARMLGLEKSERTALIRLYTKFEHLKEYPEIEKRYRDRLASMDLDILPTPNDERVRTLRETLRVLGGDYLTHLVLCETLTSMSAGEDAVREAQELKSAYPGIQTPEYIAAKALLCGKRYGEAADAFRQLLEKCPEYDECRAGLAEALAASQ